MNNLSPLQRFTAQLVIGGKVLSTLINPFMWVMTIVYFALRAQVGPFIESLFIPHTFYIATFSLVIGNFLYCYAYMIGIAKRGQWNIIAYTLLTPFYWLLMSAAAYLAIYELFVAPHHWYKTEHGLHMEDDEAKTPSVPLRPAFQSTV